MGGASNSGDEVCTVDLDGAKSTPIGSQMSCADIKAVWNQLKLRTNHAATEDVTYQGKKFDCVSTDLGGKRSVACSSDTRNFSVQ